MRPLLLLYSCVLLASCSLSRRTTDSPSLRTAPQGILLNALSEDFSLLGNLEIAPQIQNGVKLHPGEEARYPCQAPNDVQAFHGHWYVTCSGSQTVHIFNGKTLQPEKIIPIGTNANPWQIAFLSESVAYVSAYLKNKIVVINPTPDPQTDASVGEIDLSGLTLEKDLGIQTLPRPEGLAIANHKLYVALTNTDRDGIPGGPGYVVVIDTGSNKILKLIKMSARDTVSVVASENRVYAVSAGSYRQGFVGDGKVDVIDTANDSIIASISLSGSPMQMVLGDNHRAFLANAKAASLLQFDTQTFAALDSIDVTSACKPKMGGYISSVSFFAGKVFATEFNSNCFVSIDPEKGAVSDGIRTGDGPQAMALW